MFIYQRVGHNRTEENHGPYFDILELGQWLGSVDSGCHSSMELGIPSKSSYDTLDPRPKTLSLQASARKGTISWQASGYQVTGSLALVGL